MSHKPGNVILGTMRMHEAGQSSRELAKFLAQAFDVGVTKLHSSDEYDSFPLLCTSLAELRTIRPDIAFDHIVKLANPGFDEIEFDARRFGSRLAKYCTDLGATKIDDVQWMWRSGLNDDGDRIRNFQESADQISSAATFLKSQAIMDRLLCFPYSLNFALAAVQCDAIDGLAVYRNAMEREYDCAISRAAEANMPTLVIRPFNAGKALNDDSVSPRALFEHAIDMPGIEAGIVSTSNIKHLKDLAE